MSSQIGLVVAPPAMPARLSRVPYVCSAVASPISLSLAIFVGCVGLGYAGVIGAAIAMCGVLVVAACAARYRLVRHYLDEQARERARARREHQRLKRLRPVGAS